MNYYVSIFSAHPDLKANYKRFPRVELTERWLSTLFDLGSASRRTNHNGDLWFEGAKAREGVISDWSHRIDEDVSRVFHPDDRKVLDRAQNGAALRDLLLEETNTAITGGISIVIESETNALASYRRRIAAGNEPDPGDLPLLCNPPT